MVGSGSADRSKEAVGMMALHEALRTVCLNSDWTYSVFWTIRPRPRVRGGNGCKVGDDNGSLMLIWEDGFCKGRVTTECLEEIEGEDPVRKAFSKMFSYIIMEKGGYWVGDDNGSFLLNGLINWIQAFRFSSYIVEDADVLPTMLMLHPPSQC
ncbi:hypothetical protein ES332_D05G404100v1 [Gossypium tomentosum]|nr:hypothetical protein ES332_D05G404100v1 [Gossypium tomentosum]